MIAALLLAAALPGLYAPAQAAGTLGLLAADAKAEVVAREIARQLDASPWLRPVAVEGDPAASDCREKPYAAAARIVTDSDRGVAGWTFDAGMVLLDCAGWNVNEWHESLALTHPPTDADAQRLAFSLLLRLRTWTHMEPTLSYALFTTGLAYDPKTGKPTYFYTLFKTDDGNIRALVRPGGPAYEAGMRTNDVVEKLDGKWWWEYGTYQTERRAYDGKPHSFELMRGKEKLTVTLGEPFPRVTPSPFDSASPTLRSGQARVAESRGRHRFVTPSGAERSRGAATRQHSSRPSTPGAAAPSARDDNAERSGCGALRSG